MSPTHVSMGYLDSILSAALPVGSMENSPVCELPSELLVQIFESVHTNYSKRCKALAALSRVNRLFRSVATPLLYRRISDCCAKHLQLVGRTVLSRENLAQLVKYYRGRQNAPPFSLDIDACPTVWNAFALDQPLEEAIVEKLPTLRTPMTRADFSYALACVLPNVQRWDVTNGGDSLIHHLSGSNSPTSSLFQQLHTLHFTIEPDRVYQMHRISLLFTLPSLHALTIDMAALNNEEETNDALTGTLWYCSLRSSSVQELMLERCGLPVTWIARMIISCRVLREFHHQHYYWDNNTGYYPHIVSALSEHQDTLSDVRLNELNGCRIDAARQFDPSQPVSFQCFTSLTHLDIPLFNFSTRTRNCTIDELLPCNLQVLTLDLRSAREGFSDGFFISLAETALEYVPNMKSVEVICRIEEYHETGFLPLHFCHLRRMFLSYGIELIYSIEFIQCEFKACNTKQSLDLIQFLTISIAYMESLLSTLRLSGPDGCEMADHCSLEAGCLSRTYPSTTCNSRSAHAYRSKRRWGYMQAWEGPSEFELLA
jgi:hypothetical protein